jgi:hypothetical protein
MDWDESLWRQICPHNAAQNRQTLHLRVCKPIYEYCLLRSEKLRTDIDGEEKFGSENSSLGMGCHLLSFKLAYVSEENIVYIFRV